jgi:recombination protein RecA
LALRLVWEAQTLGEPGAWVTTRERCFYPPDAEANGVDLDALAVVRVPEVHEIGKAADYLVRSGAFGVVVLDLGSAERLPERQLTRLLGLARRHGTAIVCLTTKGEATPSLGGLVSVRGNVRLARLAPGEYACELVAVKDKRRPPGWRHKEVWGAPPGLR